VKVKPNNILSDTLSTIKIIDQDDNEPPLSNSMRQSYYGKNIGGQRMTERSTVNGFSKLEIQQQQQNPAEITVRNI
jgi:hypothetical protein